MILPIRLRPVERHIHADRRLACHVLTAWAGRRESMLLPIRLRPAARHIQAERRLAFQGLTAFGARRDDGSSSTVVYEDGARKLVEFHFVIPTSGGRSKAYRTVEWVTLHEP